MVMRPDTTVAGPPGTAYPTMIAPQTLAAQARQYVLDGANLRGQAGQGIRADKLAQLDDLHAAYLRDNPAPMTASDALAQKRAEQQLASSAYLKEAKGGDVNSIEMLWHQGTANANRSELARLVPDATNDLAQEQGLLGVKQATDAAANRSDSGALNQAVRYLRMAPAIAGIAGGSAESSALGLIGSALWEASNSPSAMAALAIATKKLGAHAATLMPAITKAIAMGYADNSPGAPTQPVTLGVPVQPFNPPRIIK